MVKVPLEIKKREFDKFLAATIQVNPGNSRQRSSADFVVDTGSPKSIIAPWFAQYLQLPVSRMDFEEPVYMAGAKIATADLTNASIKMQTSSGGVYEDTVTLKVAEVQNEAATRMQNILGLDVLEALDSKLVYDCSSSEEAYIDL